MTELLTLSQSPLPAVDRSTPARVARLTHVPFAALLVVAVAAPYEPETPLAALAGFRVTLTEAIVAVMACLAGAAAIATGVSLSWRLAIAAPALAWLAALALSAGAAPMAEGNAWRFVARALVAAGVAVWTATVVDGPARAFRLVKVLLASGALVGAIALLESFEVQPVMAALSLFRSGFHVVGGQLRAASVLAYPTIASMFLEVVFALGLAVLVAVPATPRWRLAGVFTALAIVAAGVVATFTRAGLFSLALSLLVAGGFCFWRSRGVDAAVARVALLGAVVVALALSWQSADVLIARFSTATGAGWYGAEYEVPDRLDLTTGLRTHVPVSVTNTGRLPWRSDRAPAFALSYHWLDEATERIVRFEGIRTAFPGEVAPGWRVSLAASVLAPGRPGCYALVWDAVHETRAWFSTEGVATARTRACVSGPVVAEAGPELGQMPVASLRPDRLALWRAAGQMAAARPLLGIGPDNYRLAYGRHLGLQTWDERVHANSLYLETLAGSGIAGLGALIWLAAVVTLVLGRRAAAARGPRAALAVAAFAAWLSIAGHGLVDTFLSFTPTYLIFGVAIGLGFSRALSPHDGTSHAHRV
jgi:hypothetical protein